MILCHITRCQRSAATDGNSASAGQPPTAIAPALALHGHVLPPTACPLARLRVQAPTSPSNTALNKQAHLFAHVVSLRCGVARALAAAPSQTSAW
jgi:hypothetical protein